MAVLLTGGAGYIGTHTAVEVAGRGYQVVIADNMVNSLPEAVRRAEALAGKKFPFYLIDVAKETSLERVFAENKIDAVIHFAGLKAVGESVEKPLEYYENNLESTLTLLKVMKKYGCKRIVFSSSATVYGTPQSVPITEEMPVGQSCTNPYGWTKVFIEQILKDAAHADPELSVILLRYFNPIGAHESGEIGENPDGIPNNLMPYISQVAVGRLPKLRIFGNDYPTPDGTGVRDYIHVVDLAKGHVAALSYGEKNTGVEIFNLGTGTGYSVLEIVNAFEQVNGVKIPYDIVERRPGDIAECYADASKAERLLGWKAEKTLEDMCRDTWNWQKNNPEGYPRT
ncbi:MAG: UDP-glucose 4-epimerase GalE [Lachnospiraceae bacterium]|nr:UDP-glucose 4-epimerase GalE [Lachnospiraceae bacterium]